MSFSAEQLAVAVIVAAATLFLLWRMWRLFVPGDRAGGCGSACGGCSSAAKTEPLLQLGTQTTADKKTENVTQS